MRRVLVAAFALALLAGCGVPTGTDGSLTNDWPAPVAAKMVVPEVGACHSNVMYFDPISITSPLDYRTVSCTERHLAETFHVGTLEGADATGPTAPAKDSAAARAAFAECIPKAAEYLGNDYRSAFLGLFLAFPKSTNWSGGARWFRCDLAAMEPRYDDPAIAPRTGSVKGGLVVGGPLRADCFAVTGTTTVTTVPVGCTASHNGEYAGLAIAAAGPPPATGDDEDALGSLCRAVVARYAGLPDDRTLTNRVRYLFRWSGEAQWDLGNRAVQCILWMSKPATKLMKGAGPAAFPVS